MHADRARLALNIIAFGGALMTAAYGVVLAQRREDSPPEASSTQQGSRRDVFGARNGELSDRRAANRVRRAILGDAALATLCRDLRVSAFNGVVTLAGQVADEEQRKRIGSKAAQVVGEKRVENQISVR